MNWEIPEAFEFLFAPARYKVAYGGRGGAKSWNFARALIILARERKLRILCGREFQKSIADSCHKLLSDQITAMGFDGYFEVQQTAILGKNGSEFIFCGLRTNPTSLKSYEGIDIFWAEEAQTVSQNSWDIIIPTIRKENASIHSDAGVDTSEIWASYNPYNEEDATHQMFVVHPPPGAVVKYVTYRDNPFFPEVLKKEARHLKSVDIDAYENVWEGRCRSRVLGALWTKDIFTANREPKPETEEAREALIATLLRVVISIDPSGCAGEEDKRSDEVGIVAVGLGHDGIGRVLEDATGRYSPDGWARKALELFDRWQADKIVAEKNFGGAMVESTIRTARKLAPVKLLNASRGKVQRAEPVAALYAQGKVRHVGNFPELERQQCLFSTGGYVGARSPDHADAAIWGITELMLDKSVGEGLFEYYEGLLAEKAEAEEAARIEALQRL